MSRDDGGGSGGASTAPTPCSETCPICLHDRLSMVSGPCGHPLCQTCMERVLLSSAPRGGPRYDYGSSLDPETCAPTLGRCPICRSAISLFEVTEAVAGRGGARSGAAAALPMPIYKKDHDLSRSPLAGLAYVLNGCRAGLASYHFPAPPAEVEIEGEGRMSPDRPYIRFDSEHCDDAELTLDDGTPPPLRKYFEEGCHYCARSRTFHGTLDWSKVRCYQTIVSDEARLPPER